MYLDALCLHCGAHFVWADDDVTTPIERERGSDP
jgi:hypothetical protein